MMIGLIAMTIVGVPVALMLILANWKDIKASLGLMD